MTAIDTSAIDARETSNYAKHTNSNPMQRMLIDRFHHKIVERIGMLAPGAFLDAGCGEGFVTNVLMSSFPGMSIGAFDFNPSSVKLAQDRNPPVDCRVASIYEIPWDVDSFDAVGCFEVLEHLHEPTRALQELARVSRGHLVLSVPHEPWFCLSNAARGKNLDIRPRGSDPDHRNFWTRAAFGRFVEQVADVEWLGGSLPWTICVAKVR
ncbi:MAG: class I SAM-dependent methyltransferase [Thermomicrobiales bacterium]|nr:class I SAM-dependent methyltransferase [Thermomicrobiales bacterium]MCO5220599.1 class I SAM-dependent methyltransferase [Thermomicrobiales bacterium]